MKAQPDSEDTDFTLETPREFELPGGCILCGGDLSMKVSENGAASFCGRCRWISHPHMRRHEGTVTVVHPAGGVA
jgi:hypothetical protein